MLSYSRSTYSQIKFHIKGAHSFVDYTNLMCSMGEFYNGCQPCLEDISEYYDECSKLDCTKCRTVLFDCKVYAFLCLKFCRMATICSKFCTIVVQDALCQLFLVQPEPSMKLSSLCPVLTAE